MTLGTIGRFLSITNYGHQIYQIYQDKNQSTWRKVPRVLARFLGLSADSFICLHSNNQNAKMLSMIIDRVITTAVDAKAPRDLLYSFIAASMTADDLGALKVSPGTSYLMACLLNNKTEAFEKALSKVSQICKNIFTNPDITQPLQNLKEVEPHNYKNIIKEMIQEHQKILKETPAAEFRKIPRCFYNKKEFQKRTCPISKEPIREAVIIKEPSGKFILYDFFSLIICWRLMPDGEKPPSWPKSVPFKRHMVAIDEAETSQITKDLQETLDNVNLDTIKAQLHAMELFLQTP